MGYRPLRRSLAVELPMAVPVIVAGLRVAAVSNISLVTVGALIGFGGLGKLFTDGFQLDFPARSSPASCSCCCSRWSSTG